MDKVHPADGGTLKGSRPQSSPFLPNLVVGLPSERGRDVWVQNVLGATIRILIESKPRSQLGVWRPRCDQGVEVGIASEGHYLLVGEVNGQAVDGGIIAMHLKLEKPPASL